jgi:hypothetical protein
MKEYISGYYCRDDLHLQIINKESNRKILEALKNAYPSGLNVFELASMTKLPIKTIYAQKSELYREYYINHFEVDEDIFKQRKRGRPSIAELQERVAQRSRTKIVIEDASGIFDPYDGKKPVPLPPGNVVYSDGFTEVWRNIVQEEEEEVICTDLVRFLEKVLNRIAQVDRDQARKWAPEKKLEFCCSHCGLNHEARDFMRAMLLRLLDQLEKHENFIDLLKDNQFLTQQAYETLKAKVVTKNSPKING